MVIERFSGKPVEDRIEELNADYRAANTLLIGFC
jgi:hypothetical protein